MKHDHHRLEIIYTFPKSALGKLIVAKTKQGICYCAFIDDKINGLESLRESFPHAQIHEQAFPFESEKILKNVSKIKTNLFGTDFQKKVWQELTHIPYGKTVSYSELAISLGMPGSARAVSSAVAKNKIALVIPCHRVLPASGVSGNYRWGAAIKKKLLQFESTK